MAIMTVKVTFWLSSDPSRARTYAILITQRTAIDVNRRPMRVKRMAAHLGVGGEYVVWQAVQHRSFAK